ncbi:zinc finger and BTB domain-containing protein 12-like isoform X1 [Hypomesus transpacificus]|uniref:zinc finger and BTB domain-containing protein 12-like isoform X1 n=1 Tax=Hypomesus transpacificus TaxID=137520 RepID=UPI001F07C017|nr:zinc finger and BTB domain-containing protein 12-like isoform X1 [Hypomesus transpacificus]
MGMLCFRLPGHGDTTLKHMNSLRSKQHFCDITIVASGSQTFRGHKVVLAACSPFLRDQFLLNPSSKLQVSVLHSSSVLWDLLLSCYTGVLQFSHKEIVNYLTAASYLQMEHVVERCRGALNKYMQPRNPSPPQSIKTEEGYSLPSMSPVDHSSSAQSPGDTTDTHTQTTNDTCGSLDDSLIKVNILEDEESREDYGVDQVYIQETGQVIVTKREAEGDEADPTEEHVYLGTDSIMVEGDRAEGEGEDTASTATDLCISGFMREGLNALRRRLSEPKGGRGRGRGRGFKKRKWSSFNERRSVGVSFPEEWPFPTAGDITGQGFGLDFSQEALRAAYLAGELPQLDFRVGETQGEEATPGDAGGTAHYSLDEEGRLEMGALPTDEVGDESVAVVGSTSSGAGPVACEHCGLTFPSAHSLAVHSRSTHLLYVCPCCGKHFHHSTNLDRHMSVHRGAKSHSCPLCFKTFTQKSTLCDHMNLHSGERPHHCAYCHARFAHKPALRRHLKEQHGKTTGQNSLHEQAEKQREQGEGGGGAASQ